jgi:hypothetical protein
VTTPAPAPAWRPTPADVHAVIARRPPFTETSRPSLAEAESIIDRIVGEIVPELTGELPLHLYPLATSAVVYGAAALAEQSFTPEQALGDDAPAAALHARYLALLARLRELLADLGLAATPGGRRYRSGTTRTPSASELDARIYSLDPYLYLP